MHKLSVALLTKDDVAVVENCLKSLAWADEIVILDGYSTDGTREICEKYTDKIYQKNFESFAIERDFILKKTTHDWVLSVDADMVYPSEICQEIKDILSQDKIPYDAFLTKGLTVFLRKEIRHCSWFDCRYIRLFNKQKGSYDLRYKALDIFYVKGPKGRMKHHFMHYAKESFIDYFGKIKRLSYLTALEYQWKGLKITPINFNLFFMSVKLTKSFSCTPRNSNDFI